MKTKLMKLLFLITIFLVNTNVFAIDIRVLSVYTASAKTRYPDIVTRINQHFAEANAAFANSGTAINLVSAGIEFIDLPQKDQVINSGMLNYLSSGPTLDWHFAYVKTAPDWVIKKLRNNYQADIVTIFTRIGSNYYGIANVPNARPGSQFWDNPYFIADYNERYPFPATNVTAIECGGDTFAHELGHNMGLMHSRRQQNSRTHAPLFQYGFGHGIDNVFVTIMAYQSVFNATQLNVFSDPGKTCRGLPCGVANISNSVSAINKIAKEISNLSDCVFGLTSSESFACMGTWGARYPL